MIQQRYFATEKKKKGGGRRKKIESLFQIDMQGYSTNKPTQQQRLYKMKKKKQHSKRIKRNKILSLRV